ncbi:TPA: hypothetical protein PXM13_004394 [Yersinia enterocolitica]|nr:hypothetical protein [Yersinia enterocolitica]HDL6939842.1 hypothetical protein [Yersinia enterocolitica]
MGAKDKENETRVFMVNQTTIDPKTDSNTQLSLAKYEFTYSIIGLTLGLVCVLGGIALFLNGVAGSTNWTAKFFRAESAITDAAPGAVLFVVGLFIVFITRYKFVHKKAN